jgi:uncharacterized protein
VPDSLSPFGLAGDSGDTQPETNPTMEIPTESVLLRIFIGDSARYQHLPLYEAIVMKARELHLAGATVMRAAMGYGKSSRIRTTKVLQLSVDLPLVIEIVDREEAINAFLPVLDEMLSSGLVTLEKTRVIHYRAETKSAPAADH